MLIDTQYNEEHQKYNPEVPGYCIPLMFSISQRVTFKSIQSQSVEHINKRKAQKILKGNGVQHV